MRCSNTNIGIICLHVGLLTNEILPGPPTAVSAIINTRQTFHKVSGFARQPSTEHVSAMCIYKLVFYNEFDSLRASVHLGGGEAGAGEGAAIERWTEKDTPVMRE